MRHRNKPIKSPFSKNIIKSPFAHKFEDTSIKKQFDNVKLDDYQAK